jgi:hypothetical protein
MRVSVTFFGVRFAREGILVLSRSGLLVQNGHEIAFSICATDQHVFAKDSLHNEAEFPIELYRSLIIGSYKQLNAREALIPCRIKRGFKQGRSNPSTTVGIQDANSEHAAMSHGRTRLWQNIAPTNDCLAAYCNELRLVVRMTPKTNSVTSSIGGASKNANICDSLKMTSDVSLKLAICSGAIGTMRYVMLSLANDPHHRHTLLLRTLRRGNR